jgi:spoIIIJ-associated protein
MANFFSKLFGKGAESKADSPQSAVQATLDGVIDRGGFDLAAVVEPTDEGFFVNFSGGDSHLVTNREGMLLDSFQIFLKRMLQNKFSDQRIEVEVDCDGFMEESAQELRDLAEKLKGHVLEKGAPSYVRALPPRERKIVHRHLAEDGRVKSQSIGDGFCKKIKITISPGTGLQKDEAAHEENFV